MKDLTRINLGGRKRPLKFGTNQTSKFCRLMGITLGEMGKVYDNIAKGDIVGDEISKLLWSALDDGARVEKTDRDFDWETVGDWIDEAGADGVGEITKAFEAMAQSMPNDEGKKKTKGKAA